MAQATRTRRREIAARAGAAVSAARAPASVLGVRAGVLGVEHVPVETFQAWFRGESLLWRPLNAFVLRLTPITTPPRPCWC